MDIISFTPAAVKAIHEYRQQLQIPDNYKLRIGIRQKNEQNKRLLIGFDEQGNRDAATQVQGVDIIYAPGEVFFFAGMAIDFIQENNRKGFSFVELKSVAS